MGAYSLHMRGYYQKITDEEYEQLKTASERASMTAAELVRRMLDHCLQEPVLNGLLPHVSGRVVDSST